MRLHHIVIFAAALALAAPLSAQQLTESTEPTPPPAPRPAPARAMAERPADRFVAPDRHEQNREALGIEKDAQSPNDGYHVVPWIVAGLAVVAVVILVAILF